MANPRSSRWRGARARPKASCAAEEIRGRPSPQWRAVDAVEEVAVPVGALGLPLASGSRPAVGAYRALEHLARYPIVHGKGDRVGMMARKRRLARKPAPCG